MEEEVDVSEAGMEEENNKEEKQENGKYHVIHVRLSYEFMFYVFFNFLFGFFSFFLLFQRKTADGALFLVSRESILRNLFTQNRERKKKRKRRRGGKA